MGIAAIGSHAVIPEVSGAERAEGPGPDHDGDSDDLGAAIQAVQAQPSPGTGKVVDKTC